MMLPKRPFSHSPFVLCAVISCTIPFLSACRFVLTGERLAAARDQIRLSIGCLKALAETWSTGVKNVDEIQTIARKILCVDEAETPASESTLDDVLFTDAIEEISSCWDFDTNVLFTGY